MVRRFMSPATDCQCVDDDRARRCARLPYEQQKAAVPRHLEQPRPPFSSKSCRAIPTERKGRVWTGTVIILRSRPRSPKRSALRVEDGQLPGRLVGGSSEPIANGSTTEQTGVDSLLIPENTRRYFSAVGDVTRQPRCVRTVSHTP